MPNNCFSQKNRKLRLKQDYRLGKRNKWLLFIVVDQAKALCWGITTILMMIMRPRGGAQAIIMFKSDFLFGLSQTIAQYPWQSWHFIVCDKRQHLFLLFLFLPPSIIKPFMSLPTKDNAQSGMRAWPLQGGRLRCSYECQQKDERNLPADYRFNNSISFKSLDFFDHCTVVIKENGLGLRQ